MASTARVSVFNVVGCGNEIALLGIDMDENSNIKSANLGMFVVMAIVPIVVYVMTVLVLPLILRGFH